MIALYSIITGLGLCCCALWVGLRRAQNNLALSRDDLIAERTLAAAERRASSFYRIACSNTDDGLVVQGLDGRILWVNPAYCRIMGYPAEEVLGRNPMEFAMRPADKPSDETIANFRYRRDDPNWGRLSLYRSVRKDGVEFWNQIRVSFHQDETDGEFVILVCRDVSTEVDRENELREKSAKLAHVAAHDDLTGAANRARMMQFTRDALKNAQENGSFIGLLQIDLDKFKQINDTYGHAAGDAVLRHVTDNITQSLRKTDLLSRMGGDEFVAICTQFSTIDQLQRLGAAIVDAVKTSMMFEGHKIVPSVSVGAVMSEPGDTDVDLLLQRADLALYEVKRSGRGRVAVYDDALHKSVERKSRRSDELQRAIRNGQITFDFQPTIDVATGQVCALEALARWKDARGVNHLPNDFLGIARDLGDIALIDTAAMTSAISLQSRLKDAGLDGILTGFNVSEDCLRKTDFLAALSTVMRKHHVNPNEVRIELPQSLVLATQADDTEKERLITALHAKGFSTILDSFGAGFAGLLSISTLNMSGFKTSAQLTRDLESNPNQIKALRMINELSDDMALQGIVVGIETQKAFDTLSAAGAHFAQGNWIAPPIPEDQVLDWLIQHQSADGSINIMHPQLPPDHRIAI